VDDTASSQLMERFFYYWMEGEDKPRAYIHAMKDLRDQYPGEPQKWAAFVLVE
jgi:CHAT domain-containing protein